LKDLWKQKLAAGHWS